MNTGFHKHEILPESGDNLMSMGGPWPQQLDDVRSNSWLSWVKKILLNCYYPLQRQASPVESASNAYCQCLLCSFELMFIQAICLCSFTHQVSTFVCMSDHPQKSSDTFRDLKQQCCENYSFNCRWVNKMVVNTFPVATKHCSSHKYSCSSYWFLGIQKFSNML